MTLHVYEVRPRKDHRGVDLISDALPFGWPLWYDEANPVSNAVDYAKFTAVHIIPSSAYSMRLGTSLKRTRRSANSESHESVALNHYICWRRAAWLSLAPRPKTAHGLQKNFDRYFKGNAQQRSCDVRAKG